MLARKRVGVVGFGAVGRYLANAIINDPVCRQRLELAFVCEPMDAAAVHASDSPAIPAGVALDDIEDFASKKADLIVEVAHPSISK